MALADRRIGMGGRQEDAWAWVPLADRRMGMGGIHNETDIGGKDSVPIAIRQTDIRHTYSYNRLVLVHC